MTFGTILLILLIICVCGNNGEKQRTHERAMVDAEYRLELAREAKAEGVKIMEKKRRHRDNPLSWSNR